MGEKGVPILHQCREKNILYLVEIFDLCNNKKGSKFEDALDLFIPLPHFEISNNLISERIHGYRGRL